MLIHNILLEGGEKSTFGNLITDERYTQPWETV